MSTLRPFVLRYLGERIRRGEITQGTARGLRNNLMLFAGSFGNRPLEQLGPSAVGRWIEQMTAAGLAPSTQSQRLSSVRVFSRWCVVNRVTQRDWALESARVRRPRLQQRDMVNEHVAAILSACRSPRDRLMVWLMFGCGLRCVEVHRLNVDDYDPVTGELFVTGKALHERNVFVPPAVVRAMRDYLDESGHRSGPLVRDIEGIRRLGPERISGRVGRIIRDAGVKVRPFDGRSAHGLRAAGAADMWEACRDPQVVQHFLGHADLQSLPRYLRRTTAAEVRDAQLRRPMSA